jgi:hypothetical protein
MFVASWQNILHLLWSIGFLAEFVFLAEFGFFAESVGFFSRTLRVLAKQKLPY